MVTPAVNQVRHMSVAMNVKSRFQEAYETKQASQAKIGVKTVEPKNKDLYG